VKNLLAELLSTVAEMVQAKGSLGLPKGELYAMLMPHGATLEHTELICQVLVATGKATQRGHALYPA